MKEFKEEHIEIRDKLKKLPRVKARDNFLINFQHKINLAEAEPLSKASDSKNKSELFEKKFFPGRLSWLIPGLGMAAVVIIVFTFILSRTQKDVSDNKETAVNKTELAPPATNTEIKTEESKDNLPGKDIAGDIRTERSEKNNVIMPTIQRGFNESISVEQEGGQSVIPPDKNINRPIQSDEKSIKKVENKDEPIRIIDKKDIETKSEPVKREEKLIKDKPKDSKSVEGITCLLYTSPSPRDS